MSTYGTYEYGTYGYTNVAVYGGVKSLRRRPRTRMVSPHPTKLVMVTALPLRRTDSFPDGRPIDFMPSDLIVGRKRR